MFRLPDPFAIVTVDGEQTHTTSVIKKTLNPYWNDSFDVNVNDASVVAVQIFDQKKFKKRDQGFLGVINVRIADVVDLELGGKALLTRDLKKSNDNLPIHGKLIIDINTNVAAPLAHGSGAASSSHLTAGGLAPVASSASVSSAPHSGGAPTVATQASPAAVSYTHLTLPTSDLV